MFSSVGGDDSMSAVGAEAGEGDPPEIAKDCGQTRTSSALV